MGRPSRRHAALRVLDSIFDPDCTIDAENRLGEELLEAAGGRLADNEQTDPEDGARQAHQHRALLRCENTKGDANVGGHQERAIRVYGSAWMRTRSPSRK